MTAAAEEAWINEAIRLADVTRYIHGSHMLACQRRDDAAALAMCERSVELARKAFVAHLACARWAFTGAPATEMTAPRPEDPTVSGPATPPDQAGRGPTTNKFQAAAMTTQIAERLSAHSDRTYTHGIQAPDEKGGA